MTYQDVFISRFQYILGYKNVWNDTDNNINLLWSILIHQLVHQPLHLLQIFHQVQFHPINRKFKLYTKYTSRYTSFTNSQPIHEILHWLFKSSISWMFAWMNRECLQGFFNNKIQSIIIFLNYRRKRNKKIIII